MTVGPSERRPGVYSGVRVVDFSMFLAGPYCTRLMADMGAEVVKVEPPSGDFLRNAPPVRDGRSAYFGHLNCGKKSVRLDLKHPDGLAVAKRLVAGADVVLENFRPGVMDRLGLGFAAARELKSDIVYCSVTGYGQSGPNAARPSFAPIIHAASGFDMLAMRYEPTLERPVRNRNAAADYLAATHALAGIGAALYHRATTGQGGQVDVALMDTMHHAMSYEYVDAQFPGAQAPTVFRPLRSRDGFLMIAPVSVGNFAALARAADHPEWLEDPRFNSPTARVANWELLLDTVEAWSQTENGVDADSALAAAGCPSSVYRTIGEAQLDPHVAARGAAARVSDGSGTYQVANCPIHHSGAEHRAGDRVPELGEHTEAVLAAAGFDAAEIARLRASGAVPP